MKTFGKNSFYTFTNIFRMYACFIFFVLFKSSAYLFLMSSDPNPDIRRIVLSNIAPSVKTLPDILARTRDVRDIVRKTAYTVMGEKIHIKALSIANRVRLLHDGLTDRSGKRICFSDLIHDKLCVQIL